ncbi:hypothetical protein O0550_13270 [Brevibacillus halotolerans]|uniref:hypothetical protein n=1 Tax=Brevibacillus TaxID=55080 RepID=UPI00215C38CB|nr:MULTISPECIES: hypothetical protein [Brevibacillus]MCR8964166.1 hypothetical protein [Brevibacillus laterosporus]MCZ0836321.1 hypothetical protein [Brevibacillus halotolerans]
MSNQQERLKEKERHLLVIDLICYSDNYQITNIDMSLFTQDDVNDVIEHLMYYESDETIDEEYQDINDFNILTEINKLAGVFNLINSLKPAKKRRKKFI